MELVLDNYTAKIENTDGLYRVTLEDVDADLILTRDFETEVAAYYYWLALGDLGAIGIDNL